MCKTKDRKEILGDWLAYFTRDEGRKLDTHEKMFDYADTWHT